MGKVTFPDTPINGRTKPQGMTLAKATQLHRVVVLTTYWAATEVRLEDGAWVILARRKGGSVSEFRDKTSGARYQQLTTICDEFRSYAEFERRYVSLMTQEDGERRARLAELDAEDDAG